MITEDIGQGASTTTTRTGWSPPAHGLLKVNTDASISNNSVGSGLGMIIRDGMGRVVASAI